MAQKFDVIVVGVGAMGSAACYHLAKRGQHVLGLEQFDIPHGKGSSHGYSRIIRLAYFEHADYVPLLWQSYLLWQQLETEYRQKLIHITGGLYMGQPESEVMKGSLRAMRQHHLPCEELTHQALAKRFPMFKLPEDNVGLYDPWAGIVLPERCIAAHCELALRHGAELHGQEAVLSWQSTSAGVTVKTTKETYHADQLVFASGAWTSKIVGELGVKLKVTRQVLGWVWPKKPDQFEIGKLPIWFIEHPETSYYGFPMMADNPGFKLAYYHKPGAPGVDPDTICRDVVPGDEESFRGCLKSHIPDADGPLLAIRVCMYTNTPDFHFIIDKHPQHPNVTLACGFSGHGYKFATVVGEVLADLATQGKTSYPINFLSLQRFTKVPAKNR